MVDIIPPALELLVLEGESIKLWNCLWYQYRWLKPVKALQYVYLFTTIDWLNNLSFEFILFFIFYRYDIDRVIYIINNFDHTKLRESTD